MSLAWPSVSVPPSRFEWWLESQTQEHVSPLTGAAQTQAMPGVRWAARAEYYNVSRADADLFMAFIAQMRGRAGRVALGNLGRPAPRGVGGGTPLVAGAGQTGTTLNVDGGPLSTSGWLVTGDIVGIGSRLHVLTANAGTDGSGAATLSLAPPILTAPADNAAVTLSLPTVDFMFRADRQGWQYEPGALGRMSFVFDLVQVL